jgi:hypothetical protein
MMKFSPYLYSTSIIMPTFEDKIPKPATARRQQSNALFGPSLLQTKKDITDMGSTHTSAAEPLPDMDFSKRVYKPYKPGNTPTAESWREEIDRLAGVKPIGRESKSQHIQAKLAVGKPNDKYEQEADTIADKIMTTSGSSHPNAPVHNVSTTVQGSAIDTGITATPETEQKLDNTAGGGAPLHKGIKAFMEPHFGTDFSRVKVHTGSDAAQMNRELGSHAFTHGSNIYFNEGQYQPETNSGKKLLAHELTHVVQQGATLQRKPISHTSLLFAKIIQRQVHNPDKDKKKEKELPRHAKQHLEKPETKTAPKTTIDPATAMNALEQLGILADISLTNMQQLEKSITSYQQVIKGLTDLLTEYVILDLGMSWNYMYWAPQMGTDAIQGSPLDYMANDITRKMAELDEIYLSYNHEYNNYNLASKGIVSVLNLCNKLDFGDGVILDKLGSTQGEILRTESKSKSQNSTFAEVAGGVMAGSAVHKNKNEAESTYVLYEITINGQVWKFGIADAMRHSPIKDVATRLAQQLSKLERVLGEKFIVDFKIIQVEKTTKYIMKVIEDERIIVFANKYGVPMGNIAHIKKMRVVGINLLNPKIIQLLKKSGKFKL